MSALLARAADFAARAHLGQYRKGPGDVPYVNHVTAVAALVAGATDDPEALAAALLHDSVEDSEATVEDIGSLFGARIAEIVAEVTDDPAIATLPVYQRKAHQAKHMQTASHEAKLIKIADQTCNVTDLVESPPGWPPDRMKAYLDGSRLVVDACRGTDTGLEAAFDGAARRLEEWLL